jgi:hypothetical protein
VGKIKVIELIREIIDSKLIVLERSNFSFKNSMEIDVVLQN